MQRPRTDLLVKHCFVLVLAPVVVAATIGFAEEEKKATAKELPPPAAREIDFVKDIQPLLAQRCYQCHGPDKQQAGLRLDLKDAALNGGDSGKVIEVKKSADSLLIDYVAGVDPDKIMPPKGERLTAEQVGLLRAWIDQGATWPDDAPGNAVKKSSHWAFQPIQRPPLPGVSNKEWVRNPIDAFILARLEKEGVVPSPEADRATLIRRLYLDLLGLIPAPSEVDEFLQDAQPKAYERLVERVLNSPHFGERWGRHWLDLARYADSDGYEKDNPRPFAYRYRDWVIDAINRDLPFDQFTVEQLAGDLLPNATQQQRMATGFHRNTLTNTEGGADQEEFRVAATVDRVNTLGAVWLGMTVGCAQCHTHKYDPLTQREYYQLFAFLNSINEINIPAPTDDEAATYAKLKQAFDTEHAPLLEAVAQFEREQLPARQLAWEKTLSDHAPPAWVTLDLDSVVSEQGATFAKQADGSWLAQEKNPDTDSYTVIARTKTKGITGIRLEVLSDDRLPSKGPGRTPHGNFVLSEFQATITGTGVHDQPYPVVFKNPLADFEQGGNGKKAAFPISHVLDGKKDTGWAVAGQLGVRHVAVFECDPAQFPEGEQTLIFTLSQQHGTQHTIGKFRFAVTTAPVPLTLEGVPEAVVEALKLAAQTRTAEQSKAVADYYKSIDAELAKLQAAVTQHQQKAPPAAATVAQVVQDLAQPRQTHLLVRGDFLRKGDVVSTGTPAVLHPFKSGSGVGSRLDLARWVIDPANPLTPRVTVNLWWQHLFGRGLAAMVEDFGVRGEAPSHPELLDWVATEFIEQRWSRKAMIRLIVTSATYRQASTNRPELHERDPKNVWLSHQNRFRLEAEVVRDLYLSASGLLDQRVGGPSVRPPLPAGVAELGYAGAVKWPESKGADKYRRGLYIFFQRTVPYPMLMSFDAPDSNNACVRRERSNTPLQALTLLNDPVFFECAQALGRRAVREQTASTADRVRFLFKVCLSREPSATESARVAALYEEVKAQIAKQTGAAVKLAGAKPLPGDELDTATTVTLSRVLLNLDEFVVRN